MRQLRLVRTADDGALVLQTADGDEQFSLAVDPMIRGAVLAPPPPAVTVSRRAPGPPSVTAEPPIGPREIQVRVRGGESAQQLADSLGVPIERIQRFAAPVVDERLRNADEARRARAQRSTAEGQLVVFGEAVDDRFAAHGIVAGDVTWDSYRREDGEWVVVAEWLGGDGRHSAQWLFHRAARSVTPIDDAATDLLSDRPIRPVTPPPPAQERASLAAAPPLAPGLVAFPPMPNTVTGPLPVIEDVFDQEALPDDLGDEAPVSRSLPATFAVPEPPAGFGPPDLEFDAPPLPLGITDPAARPDAASGRRFSSVPNTGGGKREESDEERAARVRVPSWDDILLGVRRKQD